MPKFVLQRDNVATGANTFQGATTFEGAVTASGGITGDLTGNAITVTVADSTDATSFPAIFDSATGNLAPKTDAGLTYNASTGNLAATKMTPGLLTYPKMLGVATDYDAQAATLTVAGMAGGTVQQNSKTGASTLTTPTGAEITAEFGDVTGTTIDVVFHNRGNQTSTITAGDGSVALKGSTVAITAGKTAIMRFVNVSTGAWNCYVIAAA